MPSYESGSDGELGYSGAFFGPATADALLDDAVNDPLVSADFTAAAQSGGSPVTALEDEVGSDTGTIGIVLGGVAVYLSLTAGT